VDERDIAMDRKNRKELKERMGGGAAPVPRVFVGNTYLGGYEEIVEMNEMEELKGLLEVTPLSQCFLKY
jgi:glutaredoxin-related protein